LDLSQIQIIARHFPVTATAQRMDYVVTNKMAQDNLEAANDLCGFRREIGQFHLDIVPAG
jgi:hypothetical protein